ncbi:hypothetical protein PV08_05668 [Exophiala spinifera]|uniref:Uncharacterized protein n=1 Tax=Exophiala spinifera TaxID=91928 RepID=A0A0D2BAL4_9EURO|nr:uncharacterized protein PV08_05668 [Exophiala spinifera]KIW15620.1 hypothetical protein PV08_05668 [Exophiala spinifera]
MDVVSRALEAPIPLSIAILSDLGKGALRQALRQADQVPQLQTLWKGLILTVRDPQVLDKHITAACNALCVFINASAASPCAELRCFTISREVWLDAFQCAHKAFDDGMTKPAFQVLETLCDMLKEMSDTEVDSIMTIAVPPLVEIVLLCSPRSGLKKACLMLAGFVRKTQVHDYLERFVEKTTTSYALAWKERLVEHHITVMDLSEIGNGSMPSLLLALIFASIDVNTRSTAIKTCSALCSRGPARPGRPSLHDLVESVIGLYLERNHEALGDFAQNILPVVLDDKHRFAAFARLHARDSCESEARLALFLSTLRAGVSKSLLTEGETLSIFNSAFPEDRHSTEQDPYRWFSHIFKLSSSEIQILTYGLLTASAAANSIVPEGALNCISLGLRYLHDDADAHERGEIMSVTKRLLRRIQAGCSALLKQKQNGSVSEADVVVASYRRFTSSYYHFLRAELSSGVSYPRHILALQSLQCLLDSRLEIGTFSSDSELMTYLCNLILDPFEDVRQASTALLHCLASETPEVLSLAINPGLLHGVESLVVQTGRSDHADGMGRLWAIRSHLNRILQSQQNSAETALLRCITQLEAQLSIEGSLQPGSIYPLHGYLLGLSFQLRGFEANDKQATKFDAARILRVCSQVWDQVRSQLCVDSPERTSDLADDDGTQGPKDMLAYSWRALRDSSLVLQSLLLASGPDKDLYSAIGSLCMDQLMSLRHRGAFSTVANTFLLCCETVRTSTEAGVRGLLQEWYRIALAQIDEQADRLTRRSAGLPAMITALLSPSDMVVFSSAIADLTTIAKQTAEKTASDIGEPRLPQVHALNILKDIMTTSRFAAVVVHFLSSIIELAAFCLTSKIWAIRNCGLMLLRACINRIDSSNVFENADTIYSTELVFRETSSSIAVRMLQSAHQIPHAAANDTIDPTELVFAALDLLGHAKITASKSAEIDVVIARELSNPAWAVRDHAAFLMSHRLSPLGTGHAVHKLFEATATLSCENGIHGRLLCCRYIMEAGTNSLNINELGILLELLAKDFAPSSTATAWSPYVNAAWLDILNDASVLIWNRKWPSRMLCVHHFPDEVQALQSRISVHSPFLTQRLLLYKVFCYMFSDITPSQIETRKGLVCQFADDPEALRVFLETVHTKISGRPTPTLINLLVSLISENYSALMGQPEVLERAFACLESCLASDLKPDLSLLMPLLDNIKLQELATSRGLWTTALKLEAHMLRCFKSEHMADSASMKRTQLWLDAVGYASKDYLEFPSRLSAAVALSTYIGHVKSTMENSYEKRLWPRLLVLLYDLLNDDDEEVRAEAVTAANMLSLQHMPIISNLGLCPLAIREALIEELCQESVRSHYPIEAILNRYLRIGRDVQGDLEDDHSLHLFEHSVSSRLTEIVRSKNDLFAEERQNLYVDDVRELDIWSYVLCQYSFHLLPSRRLQLVLRWACEGLDQIANMMGRVGPSSTNLTLSHPLGVTYDHDFLVVFVQVVNLAGALLHCRLNAIPGNELHEKLEHIHQSCRDTYGNPVATEAVNRALENSK